MHQNPLYQQLFEASPHPYLILGPDASFTIMAVNAKYLEITGTQRSAIIGRGLFDIFPDNPEEPESHSESDLRTSLSRVLNEKRADVMSVQKYDIPLRDGSGHFQLKYWSPVNTPVFDSEGNVIYIIHHVEDITEFILSRGRTSRHSEAQMKLSKVEARAERMEAEVMRRTAEVKVVNRALKSAMEELSRLNQRLTELDQLKSKFFANISHELRTPLTLILAPLENRFRQLTDSRNESTKERREIELMLRNARLLYRHVTDLLDVAKLEASCMKTDWARFDLAKLVRTTASYFELVAQERSINFVVISPTAFEIESDCEKLQRVLLNLLSNAFKFTPINGRITLHLKPSKLGAHIEVQDTGPGIPIAMRERVFERFAQVESKDTIERYCGGGTGLGLAIVKDFVDLLNGKVALRESPGGGTLFKIVLPLKAPVNSILTDHPSVLDRIIQHGVLDELKENKPTTTEIARLSTSNQPLVLIVEDNIDMNQFIADTLQEHYRVTCAFNGQQGLEQALIATPDIILSDMMMPVMDGYQMVLALRQYPQLVNVPVIMLTAKAEDELRLELLKLGVQDYLSKPFGVRELLARINKLLTEHQRINEQLHESEIRFQATFEQAAVGIALVSLEGRWLRVNQKLCEMVGYPHDELMALTFQDITYAEDLDTDLDYVRKMLAGEISTYSMEKRYIRKNSAVIWVNLTASLVRKHDRTPDYFIAIIQDIQSRKETEANLKEAKRIANFGHWKWDFNTNRQTWSEEIFHLFGRGLYLPPADYQEVQQYFTVESWNNLAAAVERCVNEGVRYECDSEVIRPDGSHCWVIARGEAIRDAEGRIISLHGTIQDITERKLAEVALQQLNASLEQRIAERTAELQALNQSLESFVYSVSHDLKAPLRGVEGYSRLLEEDYSDRLDDEGRLFITNIRDGVTRMNELINDLLAYSRMERRKLESNVLDLMALIQQAQEERREEITSRRIEIVTDLSPFKVHADREGLALVLRNLLENAIKFSKHSPHPRIEFGACQGKGCVILWIRDNGIGFDMKYNQRIFEIFERLHRLEDYPGTGIGLALVKKAMQRMDGRVWAQSSPGEGATFYIELPAVMDKPE